MQLTLYIAKTQDISYDMAVGVKTVMPDLPAIVSKKNKKRKMVNRNIENDNGNGKILSEMKILVQIFDRIDGISYLLGIFYQS